jgi:hypothetical protein
MTSKIRHGVIRHGAVQRIGSLYSATRGFQMTYRGRCSRDMCHDHRG